MIARLVQAVIARLVQAVIARLVQAVIARLVQAGGKSKQGALESTETSRPRACPKGSQGESSAE